MLKAGVDICGLAPELVLAYAIVAPMFREEGVDCVITSARDSHRGKRSRHNVGHGIDLRTRDLPGHRLMPLRERMREALGGQFDVVLEADHYHIELDPKE